MTSIWRLPMPSCAASSGASKRDCRPMSARWHRSSSAAGTSQWPARCPETLNNQLGIAVAKRTYKAYLDLLSSPRWMRAYNAGARPQRLLWASTGTKDPKASATLYITALAAPFTVNTMPEGTLKALAEHRQRRRTTMPCGRRRLRRRAGAVRRGEDRRQGAGGPAARRRRQIVRQFVERADGRDRVQVRRPQASELTP